MRDKGHRLINILLACLALYLGMIAITPLVVRPRRSDLAVVFGNTVTPAGIPSPRLQARLDQALVLYRTGMTTRILVSGGIETQSGQDEAAVMAQYLRTHGVPDSDLLQDHHGDNSLLTAKHTAELLHDDESVIVVTQWFHIARAIVILHRMGIKQVSAACPAYFEPRDIYSLLREAVALPVYLVRPLKSPDAFRR